MKQRALVVVLGELARSPRMQYHCISLANNNYDVTVIAGGGGDSSDNSREELESNKDIKQNLINDSVDFKKYLPSILAYIIKPIWQSILLIYQLCLISLVDVIIVQNPPSIPTLPIMCLYSKLTRAKLIVDWHNYGYSILSLNLNPTHPLVSISQTIEVFFGRMADAGFCVSNAMKQDLIDNFLIRYPVHVLYDKPPKHFKPLSLREKHNFYLKLQDQITEFRSIDDICQDKDVNANKRSPGRRDTRFTMTDVINKNLITSKPDRPAIIMSSTSWTEDEDFDILLQALKSYDLTLTNKQAEEKMLFEDDLPQLVCVITGKGPLKAHYESEIKKINFKHIEIVLPWLTAADYPNMVASCDLGISLHKSSSGCDLPMKVVDMFGCGVPVLAYHYDAIGELVVEDYYGLTFKDSEELFTKLLFLLKDFYTEDSCSRDEVECSPLGRYKKNIKRRFLLSRWEDNWNNEAKPVLEKLLLKN